MIAKKRGPKGPRKGTAAEVYRALVLEDLTDAELFAQVRALFPREKNNRAQWFRWEAMHNRKDRS